MANINRSNTKRKSPAFFAIDFFCGAGGTTRGLIDAGGYVIAGIDKDAACKETYVRNNSNKHLNANPPEFLNLDIFPKSSHYPSGQQHLLLTELERLRKSLSHIDRQIPWLFAICAP